MYKKVFFYFSILAFTLISKSCDYKEVKSIDYSLISVRLEKNEINLSTIFDNLKPLFLETNDSSLIGEIPNIKFTDNLIFIRTANTIKIFDYEGVFLRNIDHIGNGPGEYVGISDFCINEQLERIEILDKSQKRIMLYDYYGNFIESIKLDFWAIKMFRSSPDSLYVYSGYERDNDNKFKFNLIDYVNGARNSFEEIDENKSEFLHILNPINFYESREGDNYFFEPFNDTIYTVDHLQIHPKYVISYNDGKQNVPESFYSKNQFSNVFEFFQKLKDYDYVYSTYNVMETDKSLIFYCLKGGERYLVLYDKIKSTAGSYVKVIDDMVWDGLELPFQDENFLFYAKKDIVLFLIEPSWIIENKDIIFQSGYETILNNLEGDDNPILMIGKLK